VNIGDFPALLQDRRAVPDCYHHFTRPDGSRAKSGLRSLAYQRGRGFVSDYGDLAKGTPQDEYETADEDELEATHIDRAIMRDPFN
jgi:hypothetical protein